MSLPHSDKKAKPTSFFEALSKNCQERPENAALWTKRSVRCYRELESLACGIAELMAARNVSWQQRIGVITGDDAYTYASLLAIWSMGCVYVPINVRNPPKRNEQILKRADVSLILSAADWDIVDGCLPSDIGVIDIVDIRGAVFADDQLCFPAFKTEDVAYLLFTSGSTGTPKGVPISHGNLGVFMTTFMDRMGYDFSSADRFLQMFEMTFDLSVVSTLAPWYCGGCCYVVPTQGIAYMTIVSVLAEHKISVAIMVPSLLGYLQRFFEEISLPSLRLSVFGGEALTHDMVRQWAQCAPNSRIENAYGPTEATILCTAYTWSEDRSAKESVNGIVPIGRPMAFCETLVVDRFGAPVADGDRGELLLAGPQVMCGYWEDAERTADAFLTVDQNGRAWRGYRTGDIAFINDAGNLIYCGRLDSQVKIDGHRVELGEIEHCARQCLGGSSVAAILASDSLGSPILHLFVSGPGIDLETLRSALEDGLPTYMRPKHIHVLDELPLNLNGKIDRRALAAMIADANV
jgi:amino acid adenylation domain-containing protein